MSSRMSAWWCQTGAGRPRSACSRRCSGVGIAEVGAADDVGDALVGVVDDDGEVVGGADVAAGEDDVAEGRRVGAVGAGGGGAGLGPGEGAGEGEGRGEVEADGVGGGGVGHGAGAAGAGVDAGAGRPPAGRRGRRGCRRGCSGRGR